MPAWCCNSQGDAVARRGRRGQCPHAGLVVVLLAALGASAAAGGPPGPTAAPHLGVVVLNRFPHDPGAFTQGLACVDGDLLEGTGRYGHSTIRRVELETGRVLQQRELSPNLFGEGVALWRERIVQLTWKAGQGLIRDRDTLAIVDRFSYSGEGWGITADERHWILSDGSSTLRFLDPETRREVRRIRVHDGDRPIERLNELEYIHGEIWANIWHRDQLVRVAPADGRVLGYVDLDGLWPRGERGSGEAVLNGIAYDADRDRLFVTGKYCPALFEIKPRAPARARPSATGEE